MSTRRQSSVGAWKKDADGKTICYCGCGRPPAPGRRNWASDECLHEWRIRNQPAYGRAEALKRDRHTCVACGIAADALRQHCRGLECPYGFEFGVQQRYYADEYIVLAQELGVPLRDSRLVYSYNPLVGAAMEQVAWHRSRFIEEWQQSGKELHDELILRGWPANLDISWLQVDHIVPVVEGGGQCGLENLRTLCHLCHKKETAALAARRAAARRLAKLHEKTPAR